MTPHELARTAAGLALEIKARDVAILDLRELSSVCDYFVVVSGESDPQVRAIVERVEEGLTARGEKVWHKEGLEGKQWVLLDYVDVVVHVFHVDARDNYLIEKLWGDAPREVVDVGVQSS